MKMFRSVHDRPVAGDVALRGNSQSNYSFLSAADQIILV